MTGPFAGLERPMSVAIDGPAGSGKSTVARLLAERIGGTRLDTGAMYRSVAWAALDRHIDLHADVAVGRLARALHIVVEGDRSWVDGHEVTEAIRTPEVDAAVSLVAANAEVRIEMVARQRQWVAAHRCAVVEGRDIGSVVLPQAELKLYLTATVAARAHRRSRQRQLHDPTEVAAVAAQLTRRDTLDSTRVHSPLAAPDDVAADALVIDTTDVTPDAIVDRALAWWRQHRSTAISHRSEIPGYASTAEGVGDQVELDTTTEINDRGQA